MAATILIVMLLFGVRSAVEITNIRLNRDPNNNTTTTGVVQLEYDGEWLSICHHGDKKNWGKREAIVACRQMQYEGGWPYDIHATDANLQTQHLNNFDCGASLSDLEDCVYDISGKCLNSKLAGIQCYDTFEVRLNGGDAPNSGRVEVRYDDVWSDVCYESSRSETRPWSFSNVQVVCRELGFPGAMFSRQGGIGFGNKQTIVDGYKCREDLRENSLRDCFPNSPTLSSSQDPGPSCGKGNEAVAVCAVPGYVGCYENNGNTQKKLKQMQSSNMTISMCRKYCRTFNCTHAFLHKGDTCFCGMGITLNHVDDARCGKECTGDINQVCGHNQTLSVYNVLSGTCNDPLNETNIYYYGDIFDDFKCKSGVDLVGRTSKQCVMGESPDEMKWIDIFSQCTDSGDSKHDLGIVVGASFGCFFLLFIVILLFLRIQHTHRKPQDIENNELDIVEEKATAENTVLALKKSRNNATRKTDVIDTLFGWMPFSSLNTEDDDNTVSCECPKVEVDNMEEKEIHQKEPTLGEADNQVTGDTRLAETDSQGNTRVPQNENKKKKNKKFKIRNKNKKCKNTDTYEQVPNDDQCLAETDEKSEDNALEKDEESKSIKEKTGVVDTHRFFFGL